MDESIGWLGTVLHRFLSELDASGVPYAALRNYESLPFGLSGHDLDVVVLREDVPRFRDVLEQALADEGGAVIQVLDRPHMTVVKVVGPGEDAAVLHIDLFHGVGWSFLPLLDAEELLRFRVRHGTEAHAPWRVSELHEMLTTLLHHALWTGSFHKERYRVALAQLAPRARQDLVAAISPAFGRRNTLRLLERMADDGGIPPEFQRLLRWRVAARSALRPRTYRAALNMIASECRLLRMPLGRVLRFRGPESHLLAILAWTRQVWQFNHVLDERLRPTGALEDENYRRFIERRYGSRSIGGRRRVAARLVRRGALLLIVDELAASDSVSLVVERTLSRGREVEQELDGGVRQVVRDLADALRLS